MKLLLPFSFPLPPLPLPPSPLPFSPPPFPSPFPPFPFPLSLSHSPSHFKKKKISIMIHRAFFCFHGEYISRRKKKEKEKKEHHRRF